MQTDLANVTAARQSQSGWLGLRTQAREQRSLRPGATLPSGSWRSRGRTRAGGSPGFKEKSAQHREASGVPFLRWTGRRGERYWQSRLSCVTRLTLPWLTSHPFGLSALLYPYLYLFPYLCLYLSISVSSLSVSSSSPVIRMCMKPCETLVTGRDVWSTWVVLQLPCLGIA